MVYLNRQTLLSVSATFFAIVSTSPLPQLVDPNAATPTSSGLVDQTSVPGPFPIATMPNASSTLNSMTMTSSAVLGTPIATSTQLPTGLPGQNSTSSSNGTSSNSSTSVDGSLWLLQTTDFNRTAFEKQAYVSNGYIGQRLPAEGFGYRQIDPLNETAGGQGWPLFGPRVTAAMVAGFYDHQANTTGVNFPEIQGGEQPIALIPTWSSMYLTVNNSTYDINTPDAAISNWSQQMSIQYGIVSTMLDWTPEGSNSSLSLNYTVFAHRTRPNLGIVRLDVDGLDAATDVSFTDVLDGIGAMRSNFSTSGRVNDSLNTIFTSVQPDGVYNVTAFEVSTSVIFPRPSNLSISESCYGNLTTNASTISQCYTISTPPSQLTIVKYVGIASSDAFNGTEYSTALNASQTAANLTYDYLLQEHVQAWEAIWDDADIIIPGEENQQLQLATRASLFHLLSNVRQGNESTGLGDNSIAPAGLTSDSYAGQVFWDAETWMFPSLLALQPSYAESIPDFRFKNVPAAQINAGEYNVSGTLFPWTAARYGNCTAVGPCYDYEYHLNTDIALAAYQYYASSQNQTWLAEVGYPIMLNVAEFWASFVQYNETSMNYETSNATDPDEYANFVNNPAFTNAGIQVILRKTMEVAQVLNQSYPSNWTDIANNITVLTDPSSNIVLESEGFNGSTVVKQADVILLTYPLEYNQSREVGLANLDFSAGVTSPNGPGMTWSIFSIVAAELSPSGCSSHTYMLEAAQPYSRAPYYQFSEQTTDVYATNGGTNPAYTFLTGHGGFLQILTHGYTGYRSRTNTLYLDPNLPPQLTEYTIKGFKWGNSSFEINLTSENTTITRTSGGSENITIEIASINPSAGNYSIAVGGTVTLPTRKLNGTLVEGNVAQCTNVISNDTLFNANTSDMDIVPGQFRAAAIDGANATSWQPLSNASSTMTVDLGQTQNISKLHFNWGKNPATGVIVAAGNSVENMTTIAQTSIGITAPFNATRALEVAVIVGNTTDIALSSSVQAQYINVTIAGSYSADGRGGTLAEFAAS